MNSSVVQIHEYLEYFWMSCMNASRSILSCEYYSAKPISYEEKFLRGHFNHCNYEKGLSNVCDILVSTNLYGPDSRETTVNEVRERGMDGRAEGESNSNRIMN